MTLAAAVSVSNSQFRPSIQRRNPSPPTHPRRPAQSIATRMHCSRSPTRQRKLKWEIGRTLRKRGSPLRSASFISKLLPATMQNGQIAGEQSMMAGGQRGELGVWLASTGGAGVEVRRITAGGPAERAGLQAGDIILQVNGQGATSPQAISQLIRRMPPGQAITIEVWRDGQQQELQAMLRPYQEQYQTAYRGESMGISGSGDMSSPHDATRRAADHGHARAAAAAAGDGPTSNDRRKCGDEHRACRAHLRNLIPTQVSIILINRQRRQQLLSPALVLTEPAAHRAPADTAAPAGPLWR